MQLLIYIRLNKLRPGQDWLRDIDSFVDHLEEIFVPCANMSKRCMLIG
jgi:hypothetical protein